MRLMVGFTPNIVSNGQNLATQAITWRCRTSQNRLETDLKSRREL